MTISRRSVVLSIPAAASTLLMGCGGGSNTPGELLASSSDGSGMATAQAVSSGKTSGSFAIVAKVTGSWPTAAYALKPSDAMVQGCLNGTQLNVCINDTAGGAIRTVWLNLALANAASWSDGTAYTFVAGGTAPATNGGTLTGKVTHFQSATPTASDFVSKRMFYDVSSGSVTATKNGDYLTLVFSPSSTAVFTATRSVSTSANAAPSGGAIVVNYTSTASSRTITVNLASEVETAV